MHNHDAKHQVRSGLEPPSYEPQPNETSLRADRVSNKQTLSANVVIPFEHLPYSKARLHEIASLRIREAKPSYREDALEGIRPIIPFDVNVLGTHHSYLFIRAFH